MGRASIEEMTLRAKDLKYAYLGFSEHNPSISKHTKNEIVDLIKRRNEEIDKVQSKHKNIKIFKGMETDILPTGELALPEEALDLLDYSIVSIHSVFSMDRKKMTSRILKGFSHPKAKILAHPTGRLLNSRPGYEIDLDKIIEMTNNNNKVLEINAYPNRLDLTDTSIKHAVDLGTKLVIDTDSHALLHMDLMEYGVAIAKRGWATKKDIINSWNLDEITNWVDN
jgi:DNA polymerase (family 10)